MSSFFYKIAGLHGTIELKYIKEVAFVEDCSAIAMPTSREAASTPIRSEG